VLACMDASELQAFASAACVHTLCASKSCKCAGLEGAAEAIFQNACEYASLHTEIHLIRHSELHKDVYPQVFAILGPVWVEKDA